MAFTFKHGDRPLEGYTIQRGVGRGGFGEVYYAVSDGGREVALKYLRDNPQVELRGVGHCMNLKSPHLVTIFDVKKSDAGEYFIIMEYITGPSLRDLLIAEPRGLGEQKAAFFVREIGKGLSYLHDRGVVHRDLKPGNIFYDDGYVKIGDYGLSKFISISRHSAQTASVGTVHYMAPEVGSGNYSRGIDIYALGVMLYEMLLGRLPFEGSSMGEVLMKHLTERPEVDELPEPFGLVIKKALEKDPKDRYQSVDEMLQDVFEVGTVKNSLAGFNPEQSLAGAVKHYAPEPIQTPMPSPNPPPASPYAPQAIPASAPPPGVDPWQYANQVHPDMRPLADRLSKHADKMAAKFDKALKRIHKRAGVPPRARPAPTAQPVPTDQSAPIAQPAPGATGGLSAGASASRAGKPPVPPTALTGAVTARARRQRMMLSGVMAVGLPVLLGLAVGAAHDRAEWGASAGMLVAAVAGGILLSRRILRWLDAQARPMWVQRLVTVVCCAPFVFVGAAPLLDSSRTTEEGLGLAFGLLAVTLFGRWGSSIEKGADGALYLGDAFGKAVWAFICTAILTAIFDGDPEETIFVGAGVAAAASIVLQTVGWWTVGARPVSCRAAVGAGRGRAGRHGRHRAVQFPHAQSQGRRPWGRVHVDAPASPSAGQTSWQPPAPPPFAIPIEHPIAGAMAASVVPVTAMRSGFGRAFWSVLAFVFLLGAIVSFIMPFVTLGGYGPPVAQPIIACIACVCLAAFALSKTTPRRREGFWRETARPFLLMLLAVGIGASIVMITPAGDSLRHTDVFQSTTKTCGRVHVSQFVHYNMQAPPAPYIVALVLSSVGFLALLGSGLRKRRPAKPFLLTDSSAGPSSNDQSPQDPPPNASPPPDQPNEHGGPRA